MVFPNVFNKSLIKCEKFVSCLMQYSKKYPQQDMNCWIISITLQRGLDISKIVSQLKLLSSLLELKDNGIKKLQDMSRNRNFLISDAEKTVRLLLLSQATNAESERIFSARKNIPRINYGKQPATPTNVDACSQEYSGKHQCCWCCKSICW